MPRTLNKNPVSYKTSRVLHGEILYRNWTAGVPPQSQPLLWRCGGCSVLIFLNCMTQLWRNVLLLLGESRAGQCPVLHPPRPSAFQQRLCIPGSSLYRQALVLWLWCWLTIFCSSLFFSWYTQFMCLMQVVYSKDKGLQSLNQKWCWCNYKHRLVLQRGL